MTDEERLACLRSWRDNDVNAESTASFIFLLRLLDEREAEIGNLSATLGERLMSIDGDGSVHQLLCENCATARAAALEEAACLAEIQSHPITDWLAEDIRKL
jgi:hypothetical protein